MGGQIMEWLGERARLGSWRGEDRVAQLSPVANAPLSAEFVRHCLGRLRAGGFTSVISSALPPAECAGFLGAGFDLREELHLLVHELQSLPPPQRALRRVGHRHRTAILELDTAAFEPFWRLGPGGLDEALRATPYVRFRAARRSGQAMTAYAITGRNGPTGYIQRLAVHPAARGAGIGRGLVADSLWWIRRHGGRRALVNTQRDNHAALALYRSCGFRLQPDALCVLERVL